MAFETNRTVTDLDLFIHKFPGTAQECGACLSRVLQNDTLQSLKVYCSLSADAVRAFQPGLRSNRNLKELKLSGCSLTDDGIHHISGALVGSTSLEVFEISCNDITSESLEYITRILESTPRLRKINLGGLRIFYILTSLQRFARVLSRHKFLKDLNLNSCGLAIEGIRLIVDALVGNMVMEVLNIGHNSNKSLSDITRLLKSTQLQKLICRNHSYDGDDENTKQEFIATLHRNGIVQSLLIDARDLDTTVEDILIRNRNLTHVNSLLSGPLSAPQKQQQQHPHQQQEQPPLRHDGTILLKIWHKAITKFTKVPNKAGAGAIFKLFQARPALLQKRLKRPADVVVGCAPVTRHQQQDTCRDNNNIDKDNDINNIMSLKNKRQRL